MQQGMTYFIRFVDHWSHFSKNFIFNRAGRALKLVVSKPLVSVSKECNNHK